MSVYASYSDIFRPQTQRSADGSTVAYFASEKVEQAPSVRLIVGDHTSAVELGNEGPIAFAEHGGSWAAIAPARAPQPPPDAATPSEAPPRRMIAFNQSGVLGEYHDTTAPVISKDGCAVGTQLPESQ